MLSIVDASFAGRLGVEGFDAVTLGSTFQVSTMLPMAGIVMGMGPLVSQAEGAGRGEQAGLALQRALVIAALLSVVVLLAWQHTELALCALGQSPALAHEAALYVDAQLFSAPCFLVYSALSTYLSARGIVYVGIVAMIVANLFNALVAWSLMFGNLGMPALGIRGAAIATGLTELLLPMVTALVIWRYKLYKGGWTPWSARSFAWSGLLDQLRFGLPSGLTYALELWAFQLGTILAGRLDPVALGAHAVALNLASLSFMVPLGVASAGSALIGQLIGSGQRERAQAAAYTCLGLSATYAICASAVFIFARELLPALYAHDPQIVRAAAAILPIAGALQLFDGLQVAGSAVLRAMGQAKLTAITNLLAYFAVGIPLAFYLSTHTSLGLSGIWLGYAAGLALVALFLVTRVLWRGPRTAQPLTLGVAAALPRRAGPVRSLSLDSDAHLSLNLVQPEWRASRSSDARSVERAADRTGRGPRVAVRWEQRTRHVERGVGRVPGRVFDRRLGEYVVERSLEHQTNRGRARQEPA